MEKIDIQRIRKYNEELTEQKRKASDIRARLEFNRNELERLCKELTEELGVEVTPDNIEVVYKQALEKVSNTLEVGEEILNRLRGEI